MALRIETVAFDAREPEALARWWGAFLGAEVVDDGDGEYEVDAGAGVTLGFYASPDDKVVKNRLHLDLRPEDQDAEVARAESLGARRVEIGQSDDPDTTWVVLADPEGNEFCVLRSRSATETP
jgi:hypothetical protein